jgi:hypothetical protein
MQLEAAVVGCHKTKHDSVSNTFCMLFFLHLHFINIVCGNVHLCICRFAVGW